MLESQYMNSKYIPNSILHNVIERVIYCPAQLCSYVYQLPSLNNPVEIINGINANLLLRGKLNLFYDSIKQIIYIVIKN